MLFGSIYALIMIIVVYGKNDLTLPVSVKSLYIPSLFLFKSLMKL